MVAALAAASLTRVSFQQFATARPGRYDDTTATLALARPTWRPDIRAAVISRTRINMHRKIVKHAAFTGHYPVAVLSDCAVYASDGPSPLDFLPYRDGKPLPGGFKLGVNPGLVKWEGTQSVLWGEGVREQFNAPEDRDEYVRGRPGRRGTEGVHPTGAQERGRADAVPGQAAQGHQGRRPDAADLPAHRGAVREGPDQKAPPDLAARLEAEVKRRWQPQIRAKARQKAATIGGIVIDTRARIGYTASIGTTDQDRLRHLGSVQLTVGLG